MHFDFANKFTLSTLGFDGLLRLLSHLSQAPFYLIFHLSVTNLCQDWEPRLLNWKYKISLTILLRRKGKLLLAVEGMRQILIDCKCLHLSSGKLCYVSALFAWNQLSTAAVKFSEKFCNPICKKSNRYFCPLWNWFRLQADNLTKQVTFWVLTSILESY